MKEPFTDHPKQDEQTTRAVPPVEPTRTRCRRTVRFAGLIDEKDNVNLDENFQPAKEKKEVPAATQATPMRNLGLENRSAAMATNRVPAQSPSQGVPRPAALSGQRPAREQTGQTGPFVRRPVQAEDYGSLQQLGQSRARRLEQPVPLREMPPLQEPPRRIRTPETERVAYEPKFDEQEERGSGRGLIAVIIALLVLAAIIIGLIMIPEEDTGVLGTFKRAITEPMKEIFAAEEDPEALPPTASGFIATVSKATSPYKVVFHMVTTSNVTAVRVVDEDGVAVPTTTTLSTPSSEDSIVWMFEMNREEDYSGSVQAQMQSGDVWVNTALWQTLNLGGMATVTATSAPTSTPTEQPTATPTTEPTDEPTATPTAEPTDEPTATPTAEPTDEPTATPTAEPTDEPTPTPTEEPTATPTEAPTASPTPTLSVTATPTMVPTATPTMEPTPTPTEVPTPTPTAEPTEVPTPTPVPEPKLEAVAAEGADMTMISEIYKDNKKTSEYQRAVPMNMPAADEYLTRSFGVTTFRGNAFRQNAAVDTVENPSALSLLWTVEAGSVAGSSRNYYGVGWTGQPVIAKWPSDIRKSMELDQERKDQKNLKEVIVAGLDGKIYFLDLLDGTPTREAIDFGFPMRSTPSLHPLSYPVMTSGQFARKMKSGTSDNIGLYYFSLMNQKQLRLIDGIDRKLERPYYAVGAFDTSALIDRTTNTLIAIGTNGLLYTEKLDMRMIQDADTGLLKYEFNEPTEVVTLMSHPKGQKDSYAAVESSLAMYANYAFYADMDGILRCIDTTTMTTAWAVDTGDTVRAAVALDLEEGDETTLWLYTANLVNNRGTKGNVTIRRFNAMTGAEDWAFAIHCADTKKNDVTFNSTVIPGAMASPVIGQKNLGDLVYFTLSSVSATGAQTLSGESAMPGVIIALNKHTGEVAWHQEMAAYCYSSPVAVYDESGNGWIIQACANGTITLMDGLTGEVISTLQVNGVIEGSPAVYGDTMVIGTTGRNTCYIYGIKIN